MGGKESLRLPENKVELKATQHSRGSQKLDHVGNK